MMLYRIGASAHLGSKGGSQPPRPCHDCSGGPERGWQAVPSPEDRGEKNKKGKKKSESQNPVTTEPHKSSRGGGSGPRVNPQILRVQQPGQGEAQPAARSPALRSVLPRPPGAHPRRPRRAGPWRGGGSLQSRSRAAPPPFAPTFLLSSPRRRPPPHGAATRRCSRPASGALLAAGRPGSSAAGGRRCPGCPLTAAAGCGAALPGPSSASRPNRQPPRRASRPLAPMGSAGARRGEPPPSAPPCVSLPRAPGVPPPRPPGGARRRGACTCAAPSTAGGGGDPPSLYRSLSCPLPPPRITAAGTSAAGRRGKDTGDRPVVGRSGPGSAPTFSVGPGGGAAAPRTVPFRSAAGLSRRARRPGRLGEGPGRNYLKEILHGPCSPRSGKPRSFAAFELAPSCARASVPGVSLKAKGAHLGVGHSWCFFSTRGRI
ncbi:uncharacterized protein FN964_005033 [Alca torda]